MQSERRPPLTRWPICHSRPPKSLPFRLSFTNRRVFSGSTRLRRQTVTLTAMVRNKRATIAGLGLKVCPDCGEKLFDLEASHRMEEPFLPKRLKRAIAVA